MSKEDFMMEEEKSEGYKSTLRFFGVVSLSCILNILLSFLLLFFLLRFVFFFCLIFLFCFPFF